MTENIVVLDSEQRCSRQTGSRQDAPIPGSHDQKAEKKLPKIGMGKGQGRRHQSPRCIDPPSRAEQRKEPRERRCSLWVE